MEQLKTLGFGFGGILLLLAIWLLFSDNFFAGIYATPFAILLGFAFVCILLGRITTILEQNRGGISKDGVPYNK